MCEMSRYIVNSHILGLKFKCFICKVHQNIGMFVKFEFVLREINAVKMSLFSKLDEIIAQNDIMYTGKVV